MASESPVSGERTRVLIVPDGLLGPGLGEILLTRRSIAVQTASDATQALRAAELFHPQVIVFRSELHEEVSHFCGALRSDAGTPLPKLLMVTDRLQAETQSAADAFYDAHLISPLELEQVLSTIAELVDVRGSRGDRVPIDVLVYTEGFVDGGASVDSALSSALSLSEDSMLIEASRQLCARAQGQLQFFLPGSAERLTLDGMVRASVDEVRLIYVIELIDLTLDQRVLIRSYMDSQKAAS